MREAQTSVTDLMVLQTVPPSTPTTNPFPSLLVSHLPARISSEYWSWKRALLGRFDVVHFQWPETLVSGSGVVRVWAKRAAFLLLLIRLRIRRVGILETIHNIEPHERRSSAERWLLGLQQRMVHVRILLNDAEPAPPMSQAETIVIPHGDYAPSYPPPREAAGDPRSLLYFGLIRSYKQVPLLVQEFQLLERPDVRLSVLGKPWDESLRRQVSTAAANSPGVRLVLADIDEEQLVAEILGAGLVVLPYAKLYNSGALLLALTLKTPVLAPSTPITEQIREEVGERWLLTYDGPLTASVLEEAIASISAPVMSKAPGPDLSRRDWNLLGKQYAEAYQSAASRSSGMNR